MSPRKYWSKSEVLKLKEFIKSKAASLIPYFYENIMKGTIKVRKYSGFYEEMAKFLKRTPKQCKSKFQKFEEQIYTKYLSLPQKDYELLKWIRKNKDIHIKLKKIFNKRKRKLKTDKQNLKSANAKEGILNPSILDEEKINSYDVACDSDKLSETSSLKGGEGTSNIDKKMTDYWCEIVTKIKQPSEFQSNMDLDLDVEGKLIYLLLETNILHNLSDEK
jgi:hypothetical protein